MNDTRRPPNVGLAIFAVFLGGLVGSFFPGVLERALAVGALSLGSTHVALGLVVASAAIAVLVRTVIATLVVHQIVASFGAYVSFARAFVALIVGGVLGQLITVAILFAFLRGSHLTFDILVLQMMPLIGLAVSVAILASPGHAGTRGAMEGYHVPPDAPRDWIGR
jgi:hypothetical protein